MTRRRCIKESWVINANCKLWFVAPEYSPNPLPCPFNMHPSGTPHPPNMSEGATDEGSGIGGNMEAKGYKTPSRECAREVSNQCWIVVCCTPILTGILSPIILPSLEAAIMAGGAAGMMDPLGSIGGGSSALAWVKRFAGMFFYLLMCYYNIVSTVSFSLFIVLSVRLPEWWAA